MRADDGKLIRHPVMQQVDSLLMVVTASHPRLISNYKYKIARYVEPPHSRAGPLDPLYLIRIIWVAVINDKYPIPIKKCGRAPR
ncbi:hypothetical protein Acid7E03_42450 [Acidisoma sp. 7E03]